MNESIKFATPGTALKELVASGTDSDMANKVVAVASIIKGFTKNVMIEVSHENSGLLHGEAWFYMKNTNENERFNNRMAYKVLVDLIDPEIKVGANLWADNDTGTHIDGVHCDVIYINFFGTGNGEQVKTYAREYAEMCLRESAERLNQGSNPKEDENIQVNPMRTMNLWSTDDDDERSIESWSNEPYSFDEDE